MLKGILQHNTQICCPTCLESDFVVTRRESADDHGVNNHCRCNRCGEWFISEQDKIGRPRIAS